MKKILIVITMCILAVTACAPEGAATEEPGDVSEPPTAASTPVPAGLTPAEEAAVSALSESMGIPASEINAVSAEAVDWPDGCLGLAEEGIACTQVITPGFRILLEAEGRQVEYRTNEDGSQVLPASVLLRWKREGGIAGFCDSMTVYLSGEVRVNSCKQGQVAEARLGDVLSKDEVAQLNAWLEQYGTVEIDASDPKGVSDRMIVILTWNGAGSEETLAQPDEQELLSFAQDLHQRSSLPLK